MELRHLQSFLAIADELHFGRAAARLHLAQPSLSQQLQRLEQSVGVQLVARSSHEVRLTAAGRAFDVEAREVLALVERAGDAARQAAAGRTGTIRVGYNYPAGQFVLPRALPRVHAELPDVVVVPREMRTGPQTEGLLDGSLDVAVLYGRPTEASIGSRRLMRLPLVALVGERHPWASRPHVPFAELADQRCVLFRREQSPSMYDLLTGTAQSLGFALDVVDQVDDPVATAIVVSTRDVVGFCSAPRASLVCSPTTGIRPVALPLVEPTPALDLCAAWRLDQDSTLVEEFMRCVEAAGPFRAPGSRGARTTARTRPPGVRAAGGR
ncbi:LysR substrate-binding domain-containing protein [Actinomycetospora chiangmaiensis]|uniref:LysR substrate-binding domain-containing protein n=1 Tax=Actinomycetospora chiangmaiensis TaxID=402650 RepID=UPI000367543D|nr:LysR substrate-binding domain-containing protein [Actinomycetospora chiangmaiensis]